jgi:hypothetical protein
VPVSLLERALLRDGAPAPEVSNRTRDAVRAYYAQDFACFGYELGDVTRLRWHGATTSAA